MSNWALFLVTVGVWGSTWIAIEYQLGVVAPEVSVFYRYLLAALLLFAWCLRKGKNLRFSRQSHARFLFLGLLLFCLNYILIYHAQQYLSSALTAIAFSMMLWMNILNARLFFGVRTSARVLLGSLMGIAGIIVLFLPQVGEFSWSDSTLYGAGLCVVGALIASLGNMVSQGAQKDGLPILQSNAWGMLYGALLTAAIAFGRGQTFNFDFSTGYVASLVYLAVFGSVVGFGAYLTLLGRIGAHKAGYAVVMFPVVALAISFVIEGLEAEPHLFAGMLLVMLGNLFVLQVRSRHVAAAALDGSAACGQQLSAARQ